jgi:hypothetical protein
MIGIPTSLTSSIVEQVVTGLFGETTLTLKNLKVHKEGKVRAKMLIRKRDHRRVRARRATSTRCRGS